MRQLTEAQKRHLRRLGHQLSPVVRLGNAGLTAAVMNEIEIALDHHELIKVKVVAEDREERKALTESIANDSGSAVVQAIGNIALLYRPNPKKKQRIALP
jgi:RNA-binding protein